MYKISVTFGKKCAKFEPVTAQNAAEGHHTICSCKFV